MFGEAYLISSSVSAVETGVIATPAAAPDQAPSSAPVFHGLSTTGHSLTDLALTSLDDLKAEQMVTFDLRGRSNVCDFMIVTSGRSNTHVSALADNLSRDLKKNGIEILSVAGTDQSDWVVFDANNVVIHIFRPEVRAFYQLEKMWDPSFQAAEANALNSAPML